MEQKRRDKIALLLAVVLVPLLIYLLATNIARVGSKEKERPAPAAIAVAEPVSPPLPPPPPQAPAVDPKISAEQKRIAALLPRSNPFNPARSAGAGQSSASVKTPVITETPPAAEIKLTAIVSRPDGTGRKAMINGRFLGEGDRVAGWVIVKINSQDVLLDNGARQIIVRLK